MNAQRLVIGVGLAVVLASVGLTLLPDGACGSPIIAVFERGPAPVIRKNFDFEPAGGSAPTQCARMAGRRLWIAGPVGTLALVFSLSAARRMANEERRSSPDGGTA